MNGRILLIGMNFYNYEEKIKEVLEEKGYQTDLISDSPKDFTAVKRLVPKKIAECVLAGYQKNLLSRLHIRAYTKIIVIVGRALKCFFLKEIREKKRLDTEMVLYLWDDAARVENYTEAAGYYDKIYSFDPSDCVKYGFRFLPLFYTNEFWPSRCKKKIDIYSALSEHSDRVDIVNKIIEQNPGKRNLYFIINQGKFQYFIGKLRGIYKVSKAVYTPVPILKEQNIAYMHRSKAVLDIQFSSQTGLTIRTLEALACGVRLLTTNGSVRNYDFYDPANIQILDRDRPVVSWEFLDSDYKMPEHGIYEKYSLAEWTEVLLGHKKNTYLTDSNEYGKRM